MSSIELLAATDPRTKVGSTTNRIPSRDESGAIGGPGAGGLYDDVDTAGTFTDIGAMDSTGRADADKTPTTPGALDDGFFAELGLIARARGRSLGRPLGEVFGFGHATTQATNTPTLLDRNGSRVGSTDLTTSEIS